METELDKILRGAPLTERGWGVVDGRYVKPLPNSPHVINVGNKQAAQNRQRELDQPLLIAEVKRLRAEAEWIPCAERLPKDAEIVLCLSYGGIVFIGMYSLGVWRAKEADDSTHDQAFSESFLQPEFWRPLPQPPIERNPE